MPIIIKEMVSSKRNYTHSIVTLKTIPLEVKVTH